MAVEIEAAAGAHNNQPSNGSGSGRNGVCCGGSGKGGSRGSDIDGGSNGGNSGV
jgi:hypothetical protein